MRKISVWCPRWRRLFRSLDFVSTRGLVSMVRARVKAWIWSFGASLRIFIGISIWKRI